MIQYASQGFKYGESKSHKMAREILTIYLRKGGKRILAKNSFEFPEEFIKEHKIRPDRFKGHSYDIVTDDEIIEIDDQFDSKHSKTLQKINDGIAQSYAEQYHPEYKFYRVQKHEILKLDTCFDYLESVLEE